MVSPIAMPTAPPLAKRAVNFLSAICHYVRWSPRFGAFGFRSRLGKPDLLVNPRGVRIGGRVLISKGARIEALGPAGTIGIEIGEGTSIQMYFHCGAAESVKIGRDVLIAGRVYISDHDHVSDDPALPARHAKGLVVKPVVIEDGAWLGEGCVILKGVTVGRRAVVGANAVVTKDVPPGAIVGGVPARLIRQIEFS
jgi:acetyltransferase-like isoleucine patch superfamily enzyme